MKLAYQSLGSIDKGYGESRSTGYPDALRKYLARVSRDDTEIELFGTTKGGLAPMYRFFNRLDTYDVLHNMMEAYQGDFDGYMLGNVYDPGLREGRELLSIPVTGFTENSVLFARMVADTAAIVTLHQKGLPLVRDNLVTYQLDDRVFLRGSDIGVDNVARAFTDEERKSTIIQEFLAVARSCVEDDAEIIIPGAGIVTMLLNEEDIREVDGVPILDGITTLVKSTEMLVDLYEANAISTGKSRMYRPPEEDILDDLVVSYLSDR